MQAPVRAGLLHTPAAWRHPTVASDPTVRRHSRRASWTRAPRCSHVRFPPTEAVRVSTVALSSQEIQLLFVEPSRSEWRHRDGSSLKTGSGVGTGHGGCGDDERAGAAFEHSLLRSTQRTHRSTDRVTAARGRPPPQREPEVRIKAHSRPHRCICLGTDAVSSSPATRSSLQMLTSKLLAMSQKERPVRAGVGQSQTPEPFSGHEPASPLFPCTHAPESCRPRRCRNSRLMPRPSGRGKIGMCQEDTFHPGGQLGVPLT